MLIKIMRFCQRTAMSPTTFGRLSVQDPRLIGDILRGRQLGPAMTARIERFMAEYCA